MAEGLLPAVKVFLDWLRTNPDLIIVCAQVCHPTALSGPRVLGQDASQEGAWESPQMVSLRQKLLSSTCSVLLPKLFMGQRLGMIFALKEPRSAAYSALYLQYEA